MSDDDPLVLGSAGEYFSWVQRSFSPVILVVASNEAEKACHSRQPPTSAVELFEPFACSPTSSRLSSTSGDSLRSFTVRFVTASEISLLNIDTLDALSLSFLLSDSSLSKFFRNFTRTLFRGSKDECNYHPVACIAVASTRDQNPVSVLQSLFSKDSCQDILTSLGAEMDIPKYNLLLYEEGDTIPSLEMSKCFGEFASCASVNESMQAVVSFVVENCAVPWLKRKATELQDHIQQTRRGLRNRFNLWWKGKRADDSVEMLGRRLADYLFSCQDYEGAATAYRAAGADFKSEKAWTHYAAVQEMSALCHVLMPSAASNRTTIEHCFNSAVKNYSRKRGNSRRIIRTYLFFVHYYVALGELRRASELFLRMSSLDFQSDCAQNSTAPAVYSGVFLEESACCFRRQSPPMKKKYAFNLVLAAFRYSQGGLRDLSVRCYENALKTYKKKNWRKIEEFLYLTLGRLAYHVKEYDNAAEHFHKFMKFVKYEPADKQQNFWREFTNIMNMYVGNENNRTIEALCLPDIDASSSLAFFSRHYSHPVSHDDETQNSQLVDSERSLLRTVLGRNAAWQRDLWCDVCVQDETVGIDVVVSNPLQIDISVNEFHVVANLLVGGRSRGLGSVIAASTPLLTRSLSIETLTVSVPTESLSRKAHETEFPCSSENNETSSRETPKVECKGESFTISAGETRIVRLSVIPRASGILQIKAFAWKLSDLVWGHISLSNEMMQKLRFRVSRPLPRLELYIRNVPNRLVEGQIAKATIVIRNTGAVPSRRHVVKLSHPSFFIVNCSSENSNSTSSSGSSFGSASKSIYTGDLSFLDLDKIADVLMPSQEVTIPILVRGSRSGKHNCHFILYFEEVSDEKKSDGVLQNQSMHPFRLTRLTVPIIVEKGLSAHISAFPRTSILNEYILRICLRNDNEHSSVSLNQVSFVSRSILVKRVGVDDSESPDFSDHLYCLRPASSYIVYFSMTMKGPNNEECIECEGSDPSIVETTNNFLRISKDSRDVSVKLLKSSFMFHDGEDVHDGEVVDPLNGDIFHFFVSDGVCKSLSNRKTDTHHSGKAEHSRAYVPLPSFLPKKKVVDAVNEKVQRGIEHTTLHGMKTLKFLRNGALNMMLSWSIERSDSQLVKGTTFLHDADIFARIALATEVTDKKNSRIPKTSQCPLALFLDFPKEFSLPQEKPYCDVPVLLSITNVGDDITESVDVEFLSSGKSPVFWRGITKKSFAEIGPSKTVRVSCEARIFHSGVYDLNQFEVRIKGSDDIILNVAYNESCYIIVN